MCQLIVRGLRNAPVKNTRNMCTTIEVMNSSAAQWWIWRISRPPRTSKRQVQRRGVGVGHLYAAQRLVAAVVDDLLLAGVEEQRQVHAGQQQDDEAVERDLAEHERPVVRKDLVHAALEEARRPEPVVDVPQRPAGGLLAGPDPRGALVAVVVALVLIGAPRSSVRRLESTGPGDEVALGVDADPQLRQRAGGRPEDHLRVRAMSNVDWWHGQSRWWVCCS